MSSAKTKAEHSRGFTIPLFAPKSEWVAPRTLPNLQASLTLGIDLETRDPNLESMGPGGIRDDGEVVGVSLSTLDKSFYFPLRHLGGGNMDPGPVTAYLVDLGKQQGRTWVGANLQYELEWLSTLGVNLRGKFIDVQVVEALIDEEQDSYSLESLCNKYLGGGKDETLLKEAASAHGVHPKSGLWKLPAKYVGPYAEYDSAAPLKIFAEQLLILRSEDLQEIFELEMAVLPLMWEMRKQGIRIDLEKASNLSKTLMAKEEKLRSACRKDFDVDVDEWSGPQLARVCERLKIGFPRTAKGAPSFEGDWLSSQNHPFLKYVEHIRELNRLRGTFIDQWIFKNVIGDRVHPQWKQVARDDGGTRTGRIAAANPNPQQVPSRSDMAHLVRELFIPIDDKDQWNKLDYSQQEPRILTHFASLCKHTGADLVSLAYRDNRDMDFYTFLAETAQITRKQSKDLTLGRFYGMGVSKMALKLGCSEDEARNRLGEFDRHVPFVREIADLCMKRASSRGWIRTICGRKRHFNFWEPADSFQMRRDGHNTIPVRGKENAEAKWPKKRLQRAHTHKALNSLIQGSAADMTKMAMVRIWKETGRIPYLQVHDELGIGARDKKEAMEQQRIAETCVDMCVPIKADMHLGSHWK